MNNEQLKKSIYTAVKIIELMKRFTILYGLAIITISILPLLGDFDKLSTINEAYKFLNNSYLQTAIFMIFGMLNAVFSWLTLDNAMKLLKSILNIGIFSDNTIKLFDKCLKLMITVFIINCILNLQINFYLLIIIAIVNLCKQIFTYGANLEKEIKDVI